ncbi:MAG TPA: heme biosynthesis HemY N-terminal domain-containing protein [Amaricoccus sp.]|uniref:heme biosynthesis protein HemY n=1 Tax=Amaricoccus sp. TaxID=1872485 RepID=UPI002C6E1742|nr:heme biosynthesis HemY N-terminal domain-containing protein [Amaricoccus sp.]HMQ95011.1 heme biosynthesis HemY N-terminal domain-containing protein [Amaricoccus sp.]HMR50885.1 heme biosynthesis HemY N-terminal domain-containing protein [Amaricoccus sp.]HMR61657.1 heme biosynthesis HemY N-terminal domain-containing protein [Amaricoccus sp.]HMT97936.1 heme biosynthesis HemY N-terminal domain-containing protein [Amaricoccus sp.]
MLWSLLKVIVFLAIALALAFGAAWLLESPGEVRIAFAGREFALTPIGFVIALALFLVAALIVLKIIGFLGAVMRFLLGDETAISRYFSRARERRGFDALSDSMVALAEGDPRLATKKAATAEKLLRRPEVTRLLGAQAAELSGDDRKAQAYYKSMLENDRTRFVGVKGLMHQKLEAGETDTALALAKKAFALRPQNPALLRTLFDLQSSTADWSGARKTLNASMQARMLPRDVGTRRDAVLSLADARAAFAEGNAARGNEAALQANKLAPTLVPAAALAAGVHVEKGSKRRATKVLTAAWGANPHPDLAAAFAAIVPDETPAARRKRFETLIAAAPKHAESRLLATELALAAEDFPGARKVLGDLPVTDPTTRSLALMAAIERGQGASEAVVRGWLAKALNASRGPQWTCEKCNHVHAAWAPVCDNCGAFDTLAWKTAPHAERSALDQAAMLPLIVGDPDPEPAPVPEPTPESAAASRPAEEEEVVPPRPDIEDAELAEGAGAPFRR